MIYLNYSQWSINPLDKECGNFSYLLRFTNGSQSPPFIDLENVTNALSMQTNDTRSEGIYELQVIGTLTDWKKSNVSYFNVDIINPCRTAIINLSLL